ncbi:MAG: transcription termination factor NusA, partial [Gammaproteobacteria bacterium]
MRLKAIRQAVNDENVHFIQWSDNPKHFILNSLYPLKDYQVDAISVDDEWLVASVHIPRKYGMRRAIGKDGINVK